MNLILNPKLNNEKFPLGGIGTGCVEIDKSGAFTGILLHNSVNEEFFEHFFLEFVVKITDSCGNCRVIALKDGKCTFSFPYAFCTYECKDFPVTINMTAFNPFIPNNMVDSAIPAVYFDIELENRTEGDLFFSCALVSKNIFDECRNKNGISKDAEIKYVKQLDLMPREYDLQNVGELIVSSNCEEVSFLENFRYDTQQEKNEFYSLFERQPFFDSKNKDDSLGRFCALCAHTSAIAGKSSSLSFVYAWHFPFVFNKWSTNFEDCNNDAEILKNNIWQNCYTSFFEDSAKCAEYCFKNKESLKERTDAYFNALKNANIDEYTLDAVLKSLYFYKYPSSFLVLRGAEVYFIDDSEDDFSRTVRGDFSFAYLFPHWARKQRLTEFCALTDDEGKMNFCTTKSLEHIYDLKSTTTDRFYSVLKAYREFAHSADMKFLKEIWEKLKLVFDTSCAEASANFSDLFFMQSADACIMLCAHKAMLDLSIAVKERKSVKKYTSQYFEFLSAFEKYLDDCRYNYFQLICNEMCQNFGLCEVFNNKRVINTLDEVDFDETDPLYLSSLLRYGKYERYKKKLSESAHLLLQGVNTSDYVYSALPCAFCLYSAHLGLFFNKNLQKLYFAPKISFSDDGTFTYPLCFAEISGFVEIGADYFQIKLLSGSFSVKEIKIHTVPYTLLFGGRKMGFSKAGNCALLDFDIEMNSKKDIMIWI